MIAQILQPGMLKGFKSGCNDCIGSTCYSFTHTQTRNALGLLDLLSPGHQSAGLLLGVRFSWWCHSYSRHCPQRVPMCMQAAVYMTVTEHGEYLISVRKNPDTTVCVTALLACSPLLSDSRSFLLLLVLTVWCSWWWLRFKCQLQSCKCFLQIRGSGLVDFSVSTGDWQTVQSHCAWQ